MATQIDMPLVEQMERKPDSFMALVDKLKGMPPEAIGSVLDAYERFLKIQAKQAYDEAMQQFKANMPTLIRNKTAIITGKDGKQGYSYKYVTLDNGCELLDPVLLAHGFTYRWTSSSTDKGYFVTCILTHRQGHSEATVIGPAPMDNSGGKNPVQAVGSTTFYLQRYSLFAAVGVAPKNLDLDGKTPVQPQGGKMDAEELDERDEHFDKCLTYQEVDAHYKASFEEAHKHKDQNAKDTFIAAKKRAYARLREKQ